MKVLITFLVVFVSYSVSELYTAEWTQFKSRYGLQYDDEVEDTNRMHIYFDNKYRINAHNALYATGNASFKLKMNKFGANYDNEIPRLGLSVENELVGKPVKCNSQILVENFTGIDDAALDWRKKALDGSVKDQRDCNSAWAFSAVGAIEGYIAKKSGKSVELSAQSLIDFTTPYGNRGCEGGDPNAALKFVEKSSFIYSEESYPYKATSGEHCLIGNSVKPYIISGQAACVNGKNETILRATLKAVGSLSVTIDARSWKFRFYHSGIYTDDECSSADEHLNHPMLLVGEGESHWLVKNSWGTGWGEEGYIKLPKNSDKYENHCGIGSKVYGFVVAKIM